MKNEDSWKDDYLTRESISIGEFNSMKDAHQLWILANKHIFYNEATGFTNLLHPRNSNLLNTLRKSNKHVRPERP
jgi:hypothetical protein